MPATVQATSNVGIISVGVSIYCITLFCIQFFMKHEAKKVIIILSYTSLILMACAAGFISLTYYYPRLWSNNLNSCYCHPLWSAALISYISSMYLLKAMYVTRIHIISKGSVLGTPETKKGLKITRGVLIFTCIVCLSLMMFLTDGECHLEMDHKGCMARFHVADIYSAIIMIIVDGILFGAFCYKWYKVMQIFKMSENDHKIPVKVIQSFIIQFSLTIIAMSSCLFDGVMHLAMHDEGKNYHITMIIFLFDCTVVATCNFCMISESQAIIRKFICFCCHPTIQKDAHPVNTRNSKPSIAYLSSKQHSNVSYNSSNHSSGNGEQINEDNHFNINRHSMPSTVPKYISDGDPIPIRSRTNSFATEHNLSSVASTALRMCEPDMIAMHSMEQMPDTSPKLIEKVTDYNDDDDQTTLPPLSMTPTNSTPVDTNNKHKTDEMKLAELNVIREEIKECVRKGSVVIVYEKDGDKEDVELIEDDVNDEIEIVESNETP